MDAKDAVEKLVPDDSMIGIGGMHMHNNPMALIREIIRQNKKVKTLVTSPSGSVNADLLVGSGLVSEILTCYVGLEHLGLAPNYRKFVESGKIKLRDVDEGYIVYGLRAGASSLPFMAFPQGITTDLPKVNREDYKYTKDPFTGDDVLCAKAIQPDVAIVHCQKSDKYGNGIFEGSIFTDFEMIKASDKVVLQVEEVVPTEYIQRHSKHVTVPSFLVDAVVHVPFGCHPTASHNYYDYDEEHLKTYLEMAKGDFSSYLKDYIFECKTHSDYIEKIGGRAKIQDLVRA